MTTIEVNTIRGQNGISSTQVNSNLATSATSSVQNLTCTTVDVQNLTSVTGVVTAPTLGNLDSGNSLTSATASIGTLNTDSLTTSNLNLGGTAVLSRQPFAAFAYAWNQGEVYYSQMKNLVFGGYTGIQGDTDGYQPTDAVDDIVNNGRFDYFTFGGQTEVLKNFTPQVFQMLFITPPPNDEYTVVISGQRLGAQRSSWSCFLSGEDITGYPSSAGGKRLRERFAVQAPLQYVTNGWVHGMVFA